MIFLVLLVGLLIVMDIIYQGHKNWVRSQEPTPPVEYDWGDEESLLLSDPEFPAILADTKMAELERSWDKAHPSVEEQLREQLAAREADINRQAATISEHQMTIKSLNAIRGYNSIYGTYYPVGTIVNMPKTVTEKEYQSWVKKWALQLAETANIPESVVTVPQMRFAVAKPVEARLIEESVTSGGPLFDKMGDEIDNYFEKLMKDGSRKIMILNDNAKVEEIKIPKELLPDEPGYELW